MGITLSHAYRNWFFAVTLTVVTALAYQPAWHGGPIWDDDTHLITSPMRSWRGLERIWLEPNTTHQYHPLVDTVFWVEEKLWGASTFGYHLINILLHVSSALLLFNILRKLQLPGAWLAAAIFALHPVQVESVAWLVELKNTLSGVFFFAAALAYLKFDQNRNGLSYAVALILFGLGLLAKPILAVLPVTMLIVQWWKRRDLKWKRDVLPLFPFFAFGIAAGLITGWMERKFSGAEGNTFNLPPMERILIAGRAFWFYLAKLFWPADLVLIYPRWHIDQAAWWQYFFPVATISLFVLLWVRRRRWPAPFAAMLFFAALLFPLLGFFNVYFFKFSFVADHFQYLASVGIITLICGAIGTVLIRLRGWRRALGYALCLGLVATLTTLTFAQSRFYRDGETANRRIIAKNPGSAAAHNNLASALLKTGQTDEAIRQCEEALEIQPDHEFAHYNLAAALLQKGELDQAISHLEKVLQTNPNHALAHYTLGNIFAQKGNGDLAIDHYRQALIIDPEYIEAHGNLGNILLQKGDIDGAIAHYQKAVELDPENATAQYDLAIALLRQKHLTEAIAHFQAALRIDPNYPDARYFLNEALAQKADR